MGEHFDVSARFDGAAHWATLTPDEQRAVGAAALEWMAADALRQRAYEDAPDNGTAFLWERVGMAAAEACRSAILDVFVEAVPRADLEAPAGQPRVPSLLGMVCEACGCSEDDACDQGCAWARDNLCTACVAEPAHG